MWNCDFRSNAALYDAITNVMFFEVEIRSRTRDSQEQGEPLASAW